jgi:signal transduction histidine kinase
MVYKMEGIESQVKHMTSFLNDILAIDRAEPGKVKVSKTEINLGHLFDRIIEDVQSRTGHTHEIETSFPREACVIQTDERFLKNIFGNLIHNAIKFSPANRCVTVNMFHTGRHICIEVVDRGVGIPQHEISQIFESFHRASNAKDIEGTGLGLAIVRKAVDLLGGEVTVSSELGAGSVFKVKLPVS